MELIDRYLQAVKTWLPKEQADDIVAELSSDIRSQIEDRETRLGHKLNDGDIEALLKQRGRPELVAIPFWPPESVSILTRSIATSESSYSPAIWRPGCSHSSCTWHSSSPAPPGSR